MSYHLAKLNKLCEISKPEQVKLAIAEMNVADSYKANLVKSYNYLCVLNQIEWKKPRYKAKEKVPLVPTAANVSKIISASTKKFATIYALLPTRKALQIAPAK